MRVGWSASRWMLTRSAPALQKSATYRTGLSIIRCTSKNISVWLRMDLTTGMPMVMLGTKAPSITSTCTQSAVWMRWMSRSKLQKSADKIDGATFTIVSSLFTLLFSPHVSPHGGWAAHPRGRLLIGCHERQPSGGRRRVSPHLPPTSAGNPGGRRVWHSRPAKALRLCRTAIGFYSYTQEVATSLTS